MEEMRNAQKMFVEKPERKRVHLEYKGVDRGIILERILTDIR
jgi:hypothetical protein